MVEKGMEPMKPWGDSVGQFEEVYGPLSKVFFVLASLFFLLAEAIVVHSLWFTAPQSLSILKRINLPLSLLLPLLSGVGLYGLTGRMSKAGEVSLSAAMQLKFYIGMMVAMTYVAINVLVNVSFP
jgi:hypothetical protein